ncbi:MULTISPECIES: pur operon repressor [Priestia]|jgi:purine operon repressor|uniref:Pur operon repressor n=3 Tax=Priestia TaxID=2800373 RepID=A0A0H4KER4_9BACI|nr:MULTISPECIES: pur operon repressor [Priestia]AKO90729.1 pur operon repressor [Priestia filamentosa]AVD54098.1 pur operon repressor [Priestia filamentosa]KAB2489574.1 pur operon repressor [Priestia endophytica]KYG32817.1 transcriptional regulator [Priestia endophytica]MBG9812194.1 purine operon repressor [Priestia endophytica]
MKFRRSGRLIDMTHYFLQHPRRLIPLTYFADKYKSAKSSISEDMVIVKQTFEQQGIGTLITLPGAAGGVKFIPKTSKEEAKAFVDDLCEMIESPERLLPGGYLYLTDILGNPKVVNKIGRLFASTFANRDIDVVMTVATKGIPLAYAVAQYLNVPVVIVRKDSKVTEGSTVSINYVSGSSKRIQTMLLAKRSLSIGSRVLIIDDFMKAGGTVNGMISLLEEFQATVEGIGVLVESEDIEERLVDEYISLVKLCDVDTRGKQVRVTEGNYFQYYS